MDGKRVIEDSEHYLMQTYRRFPVAFRKGSGVKLWSHDNKEYLDFLGGVATNVLGHCHPKVVVAVQKQAQRLIHISNFFHIDTQARLGQLLVENSFADRVFFCNSGTEANEAAIKLARKYARIKHDPSRFEIISTLNSFHGRTMGSLSATGQEKMQKPFEPLVPGFRIVPFDDVQAIADAISPSTAAVILEPIQGESGVRVPSPTYLKEVRKLCDQHGVLMILDEVQTGIGRTGKLFAYEHSGVSPDIMTLAKGLGGGVPIGAMLARDAVAIAFEPGDHGSTFGGNPLACAAGVATLEAVLDGGFVLDQCRRMGAYLMSRLGKLKDKHSVVKELRGVGLLVAMELTVECRAVSEACLERGLLINCTAGNVLRFMPPLIVQEQDIDRMAEILDSVLNRLA